VQYGLIKKKNFIINNKIKLVLKNFINFSKKNYLGQQFCNYSFDLNYFLMRHWIRPNFFLILRSILSDIFSLTHLHDYSIFSNENDRKFNKLVITWSDIKSFELNNFHKDKYFNIPLNYKKNIAWLIIIDDDLNKIINFHKYKNIFFLYRKKKNIFYRILKIFFEVNKFIFFSIIFLNPSKFIFKINFKYHFANKFIQLVKKKINLDNIEIFMPYEAQPFQKKLIYFVKKNFKKTQVFGYLHTFPSLPLHYLNSRLDTPHKLILNSIDQYNFLIKKLKWNKKNLILKKSARFHNKRKLKKGIYFPINIFSYNDIENKFKKVIYKYYYEYNFSNLEVFMHPSTSKSKNFLKLNYQIKKIIKSTLKREKKLKDTVIIIGSSSAVIEALMQGNKVIHVVENEELDIYSSFFWKGIKPIWLDEGIYKYEEIDKKKFLFKNSKKVIKYF
jgi:hypothetical protein